MALSFVLLLSSLDAMNAVSTALSSTLFLHAPRSEIRKSMSHTICRRVFDGGCQMYKHNTGILRAVPRSEGSRLRVCSTSRNLENGSMMAVRTTLFPDGGPCLEEGML